MDIHFETRSSLREFLYFLFKRKTQILLFFFATVSAVTIATFVMQPTYEGSSRLLVKIGRENLYVPVAAGGNSNPVLNVNQDSQINSEIEILRSRALAEEVVNALGPTAIYKDLGKKKRNFLASLLPRIGTPLSTTDKAVLMLQKDLNAEAVKRSNVIQVFYENEDPEMAAAVVNSLVNLYMDRHLDVYKNPESYTFFEEQSRLLQGKLTSAEEALKAFKEKHNLSSLQEQRTFLLQEDSALRMALNQNESAITEMQNRLKQLHHLIASVPKNIPQGEEVNHNPHLVSNLQAKMVELELKEKELSTKYTDQSRLVRNVRDEISLVRQRLDQLEAKRYGNRTSGINTTYQRLEEDLLRNDAELKALLAKKETTGAQLGVCQIQLENLNRFEVQLDQLARDVDVNRENYRLYLKKFEESRISNAMDSERIANVSLIEAALPPLKPKSPKVLLNLALGTLLGAFGALGLAFSAEYLDDSLENPEQAERVLAVPVLASVPQLTEGGRK
ncbi:MAG: hypothetical protein CVU57_14915 [Deltaproteobacteria bacterium HGW-Deltaproteobacteria-15]|jgi:uncharacterized protein involved in exopolysaccharide biosynthesis|nr:MAG: hypothetical protein CVU57_14915 [Deltaproteobacteria bacterium HGW-Deltaproteobacteria-15]